MADRKKDDTWIFIIILIALLLLFFFFRRDVNKESNMQFMGWDANGKLVTSTISPFATAEIQGGTTYEAVRYFGFSTTVTAQQKDFNWIDFMYSANLFSIPNYMFSAFQKGVLTSPNVPSTYRVGTNVPVGTSITQYTFSGINIPYQRTLPSGTCTSNTDCTLLYIPNQKCVLLQDPFTFLDKNLCVWDLEGPTYGQSLVSSATNKVYHQYRTNFQGEYDIAGTPTTTSAYDELFIAFYPDIQGQLNVNLQFQP